MEEKLRQTERQLDAAMAEIGRNSLVNEMTYSLQASNTIEEIYENVGRFGARLFPKNSGALCIVDSSKNLIETTASWGDTSRFESVFAADTCHALGSARPHLVQNSSNEMMCAHVIGKKGAHLCMPMVAQSETLGILHLFDPIFHESGDAFTPMQLRLAEKVAEQIALPLANLRLRDVLQQQALRDPLTGLYNRRFFSEALHRELRRAVRKHSSVGLIMLDLDHFKRFNDTHGHPAGDALLNSVSALLQSGVRAGDVLCRLGGDEFSVLMPEATLDDTIARAHELRNAVKALNLKWHEQSLPGISISCGAAAFPIHGTTAEGLLERADAGLYLAKESGRDQVMTSIASSSAAG
jgi:diguanylate cyclase (GGDEF)-like protein